MSISEVLLYGTLDYVGNRGLTVDLHYFPNIIYASTAYTNCIAICLYWTILLTLAYQLTKHLYLN